MLSIWRPSASLIQEWGGWVGSWEKNSRQEKLGRWGDKGFCARVEMGGWVCRLGVAKKESPSQWFALLWSHKMISILYVAHPWHKRQRTQNNSDILTSLWNYWLLYFPSITPRYSTYMVLQRIFWVFFTLTFPKEKCLQHHSFAYAFFAIRKQNPDNKRLYGSWQKSKIGRPLLAR